MSPTDFRPVIRHSEQSPGLRFHAAQFCGLPTRPTHHVNFSAISATNERKHISPEVDPSSLHSSKTADTGIEGSISHQKSLNDSYNEDQLLVAIDGGP
jgi:hypothetical protein